MADKDRRTEKPLDVEAMRDSWMIAVAEGHAEGFSRHFVPDILDALSETTALLAKRTEALDFAIGYFKQRNLGEPAEILLEFLENAFSLPAPDALRLHREEVEKAHLNGQQFAYRQAHDMCLRRSKDAIVSGMPNVLTEELESRAQAFKEVAEELERLARSQESR
jgi:hypothetical protein